MPNKLFCVSLVFGLSVQLSEEAWRANRMPILRHNAVATHVETINANAVRSESRDSGPMRRI